MDVELARTPTGAKVFTALEGAVDGELDVSYAEKRILGHDIEVKPLDDVHRTHTFGKHKANNTRNMSEENKEAYKKQFHRDIKVDATPASIQGMYTKTHAAIRVNSSAKTKVATAKMRGTGSSKLGKKTMSLRKRSTTFARKRRTLWKLRITVYGRDEARKGWYETIYARLIQRTDQDGKKQKVYLYLYEGKW